MYSRIVVARSMDADVAQLRVSHRGTRNRAWRIVTGCFGEALAEASFWPWILTRRDGLGPGILGRTDGAPENRVAGSSTRKD